MNTHELVDTLLRSVPTDMARLNENEVMEACYSETLLISVFGSGKAGQICRAFDGVPIFKSQLRFYLYGCLDAEQ